MARSMFTSSGKPIRWRSHNIAISNGTSGGNLRAPLTQRRTVVSSRPSNRANFRCAPNPKMVSILALNSCGVICSMLSFRAIGPSWQVLLNLAILYKPRIDLSDALVADVFYFFIVEAALAGLRA